jgi:hypothetical protein
MNEFYRTALPEDEVIQRKENLLELLGVPGTKFLLGQTSPNQDQRKSPMGLG